MATLIDQDVAVPVVQNHGEASLPNASVTPSAPAPIRPCIARVLAISLNVVAACGITAQIVGAPGSRPSDLWTGQSAAVLHAPETAEPAAAVSAPPVPDEAGALEQAFNICARGGDPLLSGNADPDYGDLAGNPLVAEELQPACALVSMQHPDLQTKAMATVNLGRIALANHEDGGWFLRRAEAIAPGAAPVQLLRLQADLAGVETSQEPFNDVSALRGKLDALRTDLSATAIRGLAARIDKVEFPGAWNDTAMVRHALFGTPTAEPIVDMARISFLQGVMTACEAFGFKPNMDQSIGVAMARFKNLLNSQVLLWQEPYTDGTQLGRELNCAGARLNQAFQRIAEPLAADGASARQSLTGGGGNQ